MLNDGGLELNIKKHRNDIVSLSVIIVLGIVIILMSKFIFQSGQVKDRLNKDVEYYKAKVISINKEELQEDMYIEDLKLGIQDISIRILDGKYKGQEFDITNRISRLYNMKVEDGTRIIVAMYYNDNEVSDIAVYSYERSRILTTLIGIFVIVILLVGGFKGLKAIVSLVFTLVCVVFLMLPLMLRGISPIVAAIIIAIISIIITLLLVSGKNKKTYSAIIGTISGVIISGIIAFLFGNRAHLSGITMEYSESMMYISEVTGLKVSGIMFAGILVASLGAVMDVAMSISSSIFEIYSVNNKMNIKELIISGMNIGRDIIGTMSNTLILAFAGGSLNTLILLYTSNMVPNQMFNLDIVGTEIIQGLAGSIGIVLTVPITAIVSAYLCNIKVKKNS